MDLKEVINKIEHNQQAIQAYGKFEDAVLKRINYKIRLDWNYYSNQMEGGTLTKDETRSVMVGNLEVKGKPFKDVAEMNGHDKMVSQVLKMSKGEVHLSEKRIKEIHTAIMYEENETLKPLVGNWKTIPNEIINYRNEKISFTAPAHVPEAVHKLIDRTNAELDRLNRGKSKLHPLEVIAQFHIDFISTHPFYDGNGRTTRILTNILLLKCGLPAIIIKENQKEVYYRLLADIQAYGGNNDLFYKFIGERIIETQELVLKALRGENIEDEDDLDKEIEMLKRQGNLNTKNKTPQLIYELFRIYETNLFTPSGKTISKFNPLFSEQKEFRKVNDLEKHLSILDKIEIAERLVDQQDLHIYEFKIYETDIESISYEFIQYGLMNAVSETTLEFSAKLIFKPSEYKVIVKIDRDIIHEQSFPYNQFPSLNEFNVINKRIGIKGLENIKAKQE